MASSGTEAGWSALVPLLLGVLALAGFVLAECRAAEPITPLRIFAVRGRSSAYAGRLLGTGRGRPGGGN